MLGCVAPDDLRDATAGVETAHAQRTPLSAGDEARKLNDPADSVAEAIVRWNRKGRPAPHREPRGTSTPPDL